jgi:hypothetical protein
MAKEIQKSLRTIESRAGDVAVEHVHLLSRIRFFAQFQPGHIYGIYTYIYTPYILKNTQLAATPSIYIYICIVYGQIYGWWQPCYNYRSRNLILKYAISKRHKHRIRLNSAISISPLFSVQNTDFKPC